MAHASNLQASNAFVNNLILGRYPPAHTITKVMVAQKGKLLPLKRILKKRAIYTDITKALTTNLDTPVPDILPSPAEPFITEESTLA